MSSDIAPSKVFVLQPHAGKNALERMTSPKVRLISEAEATHASHSVTVLPSSLDLGFIDRFEEIPDGAWEPARRGRGKVVFDASGEGWPHSPDRTRALHGFLERAGVPRTQGVYMTQDRGYAADYQAHCEAIGDGPPMKVIVYDYWVRIVARQHEQLGSQTFEARLAAYRARGRRRERRFLSLNRNLRPTKALFLLRLMRDGLWDRGMISFGGVQTRRRRKGFADGELEAHLFGEKAFADLNAELQSLLPRFEALGRRIFRAEQFDPRYGPVMDEALAEYGQTWFSVIPETEMRDRPSRITEKPLKALMNFHPFMVLGNPGSLAMLRAYGFESYPQLFDESYDEELDPRRRFEMVYRQLERLCALDEAELDRLDRQIEETVIHNARNAMIALPARFRSQFDPELVRDILAPASPQSDRIAALG